ncbi:MAG: hypothetical protein VKL39_19080 [Leptolyngbyaceae bacterium]|nr:hypothetical protein [Leptolyngbyaceae bacterium]
MIRSLGFMNRAIAQGMQDGSRMLVGKLWQTQLWQEHPVQAQPWSPAAELPQPLNLFPSPQSVVNDWRTAIATSMDTWFRDHPVLAWAIDHPIAGFVLILVTLLCLVSFFQLIIDVIRQLWLIILQLPLQILRWVLNQLATLMRLGLRNTRRLLTPSLLEMEPDAHPHETRSPQSAPMPELSRGELSMTDLSRGKVSRGELSMANLSIAEQQSPSADQEIAQLLYRLEQLTQEQTQILHQIARLTEAKS